MQQIFRNHIIIPLALVLTACEPSRVPPRSPAVVKSQIIRLQPRQTVIRLTGDVEARVSTELSFRVSGRVVERMVDVGAHVKAGDVLARVDPTEQQADLEGSKAAVSAAEAQLRVATATFQRQTSLMASGFTTRVAFDQAQEGLRTAEGTLEAAKAQMGTSTDALSFTELRASASGTITARNVEVGQSLAIAVRRHARMAAWCSEFFPCATALDGDAITHERPMHLFSARVRVESCHR